MKGAKRFFINGFILATATVLMRAISVSFNAFVTKVLGEEAVDQQVAELGKLPTYDIFISSYVNSERVREPAEALQASKKVWFVTDDEVDLYLAGKDIVKLKLNEDYGPILNKFHQLQIKGKSICIDATGFKIPYLIQYLIHVLQVFLQMYNTNNNLLSGSYH